MVHPDKSEMDKLEMLTQIIADAAVFDGLFKPSQNNSLNLPLVGVSPNP